jgi:hypothetical protein
VFFRRLAKKKNRNVAVVATARKLVCIAWHMLKKNEPYRYAQPQSTQTKLLRLRVRATGQKRRGGTPRGQKRSPRYGTGQPMRTVKSLAEVLQSEGLPLPGPAPAGEARTIAETNTAAYVASLDQTKGVARKPEKRLVAHQGAANGQG